MKTCIPNRIPNCIKTRVTIRSFLNLVAIVLSVQAVSVSVAQAENRPIQQVLTAMLTQVPDGYLHKKCMIGAFDKIRNKAELAGQPEGQIDPKIQTELWQEATVSVNKFVLESRSDWELRVSKIFKNELNYLDYLPQLAQPSTEAATEELEITPIPQTES